jgi:hypothetical protein
MSFADQVTFTSHASAAIQLDSAFIMIAEMDTVGFSAMMLQKSPEIRWMGNIPANQYYVWTLDSIGSNIYKLLKKSFSPESDWPLVFSANRQTDLILGLEIGYCFSCDRTPLYPKYIKGTMRFCFSNGQVVELSLYSADLRTSVKSKGLPKSGAILQNSNVRYLADGRKVIVGGKTNAGKSQVARILFRQK